MIKRGLGVNDIFMINLSINELLKENNLNICKKDRFRKFAISFFREFEYLVFNIEIYDIAYIYKVIYGESIENADEIASFIEIVNIYKKESIKDFRNVLNNIPYNNVISGYNKSKETISYYINYLSKYKDDYSIVEFSNVVGYVCMAHYNVPTALRELEKLNLFSLEMVKFLIESNFREDELVMALNILSNSEYKCNPINMKTARMHMEYLGKNIKEACLFFAKKNGIEFDVDIIDDMEYWGDLYKSIYNNYIIVRSYNRLWGVNKKAFQDTYS